MPPQRRIGQQQPRTGCSPSTTLKKTWRKNSKGFWELIVHTGSTERKEENKAQSTHYQGFVQLKIKARLCTVKNKLGLGRGHLEKRRGTAEEARDYCMRKADGKKVVYYKLQVEFGTLSGSREYPEKW